MQAIIERYVARGSRDEWEFSVLLQGETTPRNIFSPFQPIAGLFIDLDDHMRVIAMRPNPKNVIPYLTTYLNIRFDSPRLEKYQDPHTIDWETEPLLQPFPCELAWKIREAGIHPKKINEAFERAFDNGETREMVAKNPIFMIYHGIPFIALQRMNAIPPEYQSWATTVETIVKDTQKGNTVFLGDFNVQGSPILKDPNIVLSQSPQGLQMRRLAESEERIARNLLDNRTTHVAIKDIPMKNINDDQKKVFENVQQYRYSILVGGPGTGKTHTMRSVVEAWPYDVLLTGCTAAAADVLTKATGKHAVTIHSLIGFNKQTGVATGKKPNPNTLIVVDESSMLDTYLMAALTDWLPSHARVLFVGDDMQLPSVEPGDILRDLQSILPQVKLTKQYRGSKDLEKVYADLRNGVIPPSSGPNSEEAILTELHALLQRYSKNEILVVTPYNKGPISKESLNERLQRIYQPPQRIILSSKIGIGDVIVLRKNIQIPQENSGNDPLMNEKVFNGQRFIVESASVVDHVQWLQARDPQTQKTYVFSGMDIEQFELGYATTIHLAQGSQAKVVFVVLPDNANIEFRSILTAATRAQEEIRIFGNIKNIRNESRTTTLVERYNAQLELQKKNIDPNIVTI